MANYQWGVGQWVAFVCFVSLAVLGWWVLCYGWDWAVLWVGLFWVAVGSLAAVEPGEWQRRKRVSDE